ncbi:hypothetical protein HY745_07000 [Candidatus Desantisbacteria bacterium]|nr:hypothetical protein [Candidatus Desantisbacteria bacterium]
MEKKDNNNSLAEFLIRLYWMALGNFIMIILAIYVAVNNPESMMQINIFYFSNVVILIILRYIDIRYLNGLTTEREPAIIDHWKKYSVKLIIFSSILWLIMNFAKNYLSIKA